MSQKNCLIPLLTRRFSAETALGGGISTPRCRDKGQNRLVFSLDFKMLQLSAHFLFTGRELQTVGATTVKARGVNDAEMLFSSSRYDLRRGHKYDRASKSFAQNRRCTVFVTTSFYPRDAMLARVFATATCLSVCPSVRPSVTRRYCA